MIKISIFSINKLSVPFIVCFPYLSNHQEKHEF